MAMRVGLLFGGRSGEHEVSIRSAGAIARALKTGDNADKYEVIPVHIAKDGSWLAGKAAQQVLTSGKAIAGGHTAVGELPTLTGLANRLPNLAAADPSADLTAASSKASTLTNLNLSAIDIWFPALHGPNGEDGTIQGLLELMQVPYVGCGVLGSALGMDKLAMKSAFAQIGLPQVRYRGVTRAQIYSNPCVFPKLCDELEADIGYPCFVKPANLGSSVGIRKATTRQELEAALDNAASYDRRVIVEAGVVAREVECAILGNDYPKASVLGETRFGSDFYDYETKYTDGSAAHLIPAPVPDDVRDRIQAMAIQAFQAIDAAGIARVDFFYVETTGEVLINEINTLPGFTPTSMYPMMWQASGLEIFELADQLIQLGLDRTART